jgi:hypothetical protein
VIGLAAGLTAALAADPPAAGCRQRARRYREERELACVRDCTLQVSLECCKSDCAKCARLFKVCKYRQGEQCMTHHQETFDGTYGDNTHGVCDGRGSVACG